MVGGEFAQIELVRSSAPTDESTTLREPCTHMQRDQLEPRCLLEVRRHAEQYYRDWRKVAAEEACHFTLLNDHLTRSRAQSTATAKKPSIVLVNSAGSLMRLELRALRLKRIKNGDSECFEILLVAGDDDQSMDECSCGNHCIFIPRVRLSVNQSGPGPKRRPVHR